MKNIFKFSALFCAMTFLVTSCSQDAMFEPEAPQQKPILDGDEIIFGSRAGFENANPDTRTVYSGETYDIGEGDNKKTFERIDWAVGDQVEIYCPQSVSMTNAHYKVNQSSKDENGSEKTDEKDEGWLEKIDPEGNGLAWNGDGDHEFYAMYPSFDMLSDDEKNTLNQGVKMNKTVLTGVVPKAQSSGKIVKKGTTYTAEPDMRYAYMAAKTVTTKAAATAAGGAVKLDFVPVVTALQIELQAQDVPVNIAEIKVQGTGIVGSFTADLNAKWVDGYPVCTNVSDSNEGDQLQYTLNEVVSLGVSESLVFTVFLRPGTDYKNLTVSFSPTGAGYLSNQLGNDKNNVTIPAMKKTIVNDFLLPKTAKELEIDVSQWMNQLPDNMQLKYLSLPGTGGSFTYNYSGGDNTAFYKQQNLSIEDQWKAGIRAFELSVDRAAFVILFGEIKEALTNKNVLCNKQSVGVTFDSAMATIRDMVTEHPNECAIVTVSYQPISGDILGSNPERSSDGFAESFQRWFDNLSADAKSVYTLYSPNMTLKEARGKVMIILRPHQQDEKDATDTEIDGYPGAPNSALNRLANYNVLVVEGCGTAKDRWGARGYMINDTPCPHISNSFNNDGASRVLENHMSQDLAFPIVVEDGDYVSSPAALEGYKVKRPGFKVITSDIQLNNGAFYTEYEYSTDAKTALGAAMTYETNKDFNCWYQDWARVVKNAGKFGGTTFWFESLNEKKANIQLTFQTAISTDAATSSTVFINSLCGYLVTDQLSDSYQASTGSTYGGAGGDIAGLANELNPWFAQLVLSAGLEQTTGPIGVVYMESVTSNMEVVGRIISNNFKFSIP